MDEAVADVQQEPDLLTILWDAQGPYSVVITANWEQHRHSGRLLSQAMAQAALHRQGQAEQGADWRSSIDLSRVPIHELPEFNALMREARAEQHAEPEPETSTVSSRNLTSRWRGEVLIDLQGDPEWVANSTRQALSDELLHVLTPPTVADRATTTTARDRMMRFMEGRR